LLVELLALDEGMGFSTVDFVIPELSISSSPCAGTTTISAPKIYSQPQQVTDIDPETGWKVVLHNDDVTPYDVVIYGLQRAAGLSLEIAEAVAAEAHNEEAAVVKRGLSEEDAQIICGGLRKWTRIDGLCPGVICEPLHDD
jgi:ATP-dependent Clp protease adapter protein ClpS